MCRSSVSFAISENNTIYGWGWNNYGELGIGNNIPQNTPQVINFQTLLPNEPQEEKKIQEKKIQEKEESKPKELRKFIFCFSSNFSNRKNRRTVEMD